MRRILLFTLIFLFIADAANAQRKRGGSFSRKKPPYRYEIVGSLGASNFLGDLGGANQIGTNGIKDLEYVMTRPAMGISARMKVQKFFSAKGNFYWGIVRGDDKLTKEPFRSNRNLNFRSPILELSGQFEFNFIREQKGHIYKIRGVRGMKHKDRQLYLFGGGGLIYFNPKGQYLNKKWVPLRPLTTEGQGIVAGTKKYSFLTPIVMAGGGFRIAINRYWGIGFEMGIRKTWSDYIDDTSTEYPDPALLPNAMSVYFANPAVDPSYGPPPPSCTTCPGQQRGDKTDKDAYMFGTLTVGYKVMYRKRSRSKF